MFIFVPYIFYMIYNETMVSNSRSVNFKERFGLSLLGAKIDLNNY